MNFYTLQDKITKILPGMLISTLIAISAKFLSNNYGVPSMLMAILIGMSFNFLPNEKKFTAGLEFCTKHALYAGVVLMGSRISLNTILKIDPEILLIVTSGVIFTILFSIFILRNFKLPIGFGVLIGGSIAICGVSAAMAISSVLPKYKNSEQSLSFVIIGITIMSTICMIIYPIVTNQLEFNNVKAGIFFGATIHDVAQVVGAGFSISDTSGEIAVLIKLFRISLLLPLILIISIISYKMKYLRDATTNKFPIPSFILFFWLFSTLNSLEFFSSNIKLTFHEISSWCLLIAISAVGTKTDFSKLKVVGPVPSLIIVLVTAFLMTYIFGLLIII